MGKRKMKFIQSPEDLVADLKRNTRARSEVINEVRDQCFGDEPKKQEFFKSDILATLVVVLKDSVQQTDTIEGDHNAVTCANLICSLVKAEPASLPHAESLAASLEPLFLMVRSGKPTRILAGLRALTAIFKRVDDISYDQFGTRVRLRYYPSASADLVENAVQSSFLQSLLDLIRSSDPHIKTAAQQMASKIPLTKATAQCLVREILPHLAQSFCSETDTSEALVAAYSRLSQVVKYWRKSLKEGLGPVPDPHMVMNLLRTSKSLQYRLDLTELLIKALEKSCKDSEKIILEASLLLMSIMSREAPTNATIPILIRELFSLSQDPAILSKLCAGGLSKLLFQQASAQMESNVLAIFPALDTLCHLQTKILVESRQPHHSIKDWRRFTSDLEEFLISGNQESDPRARDTRLSIVRLFVTLTIGLGVNSMSPLGHPGLACWALNLAGEKKHDVEFRQALLCLYTNLVAMQVVDQEEAKMTRSYKDHSRALVEILSSEDCRKHDNMAVTTLQALANLAFWDTVPKVALWENLPIDLIYQTLDEGSSTTQEIVGILLANLCADLAKENAESFAKWLDPERIFNILKTTLQESWDCLEQENAKAPKQSASPMELGEVTDEDNGDLEKLRIEQEHYLRGHWEDSVKSTAYLGSVGNNFGIQPPFSEDEVTQSHDDQKEDSGGSKVADSFAHVTEYQHNRGLIVSMFGFLGNLASLGYSELGPFCKLDEPLALLQRDLKALKRYKKKPEKQGLRCLGCFIQRAILNGVTEHLQDGDKDFLQHMILKFDVKDPQHDDFPWSEIFRCTQLIASLELQTKWIQEILNS